MKVNTFDVTEGNRTMKVFIPDTGDSSYNEYLALAEKEKTSEELKKNQKPKPRYGKEHAKEAIKEMQSYRDWHKKNPGSKKYY